MKDKYYNNSIRRGYTLLFSIIVASVVLSIAAFILSVTRKQFVLSSVSRDSTMAIYAADSALQCALAAYYQKTLDTSLAEPWIICNGARSKSSYNQLANEADSSYNLKKDNENPVYQTASPLGFGFTNDACAFVTITQGTDKTTDKHKVIIESRGYNNQFSKPCSETGGYNPRTVERAIRLVIND